jgi:uncharacterized protein YutE (UPF0331/DUF86 family)
MLARHDVIDNELSARLQAMAGFRNIAVHDYERIDRAVLKSILRTRLVDLEAFARAAKIFLAL